MNIYKTSSIKKNLIISIIMLLFFGIYPKIVYGAQILSFRSNKIWINSKGDAIGLASIIYFPTFVDQGGRSVSAYYLCGRNDFADAIFFEVKFQKKYTYFGTLLEKEWDELLDILDKASEIGKKAYQLGIKVNNTVQVGFLDGEWTSVSVEIRPSKNRTEGPLACFLTFKNKSGKEAASDSYEVYFDTRIDFIEKFHESVPPIRDKIRKDFPEMEQILKEREEVKQQLQ